MIAKLQAFFDPRNHSVAVRRGVSIPLAVLATVSPLASLLPLLGSPTLVDWLRFGWWGVLPQLIVWMLWKQVLPEVGYSKRDALWVFVPVGATYWMIRWFWRLASLPDKYWEKRNE